MALPKATVSLTDDDWKGLWRDGHTRWHKTEPDWALVKHLEKLVNGRKNIKVFFAVCGKDVGMKWFADKGYTIIGVELATKPCHDFFREQNIEFTSEIRGKFTLYKSTDEKIRIYCGDIYHFNCSYEGKMDAIWDRGGYSSMNREDKKRYSDVIKELMQPDTRQLLVTMYHESKIYHGPPHSISEGDILKHYGDVCDIERLDFRDIMEEYFKVNWETEVVYQRVQLLSIKS